MNNNNNSTNDDDDDEMITTTTTTTNNYNLADKKACIVFDSLEDLNRNETNDEDHLSTRSNSPSSVSSLSSQSAPSYTHDEERNISKISQDLKNRFEFYLFFFLIIQTHEDFILFIAFALKLFFCVCF